MDFRKFHSKQLSFYQFWCIYLSKNSYRRKNSNWWLFLGPALHLFYLVALLALCTIYENMIFAKGDPVSKFVDIIQLVFPIAIHLIVILEGLIKSKFDYRMWEIINRLEDGFAEQNISLAKINLKMKTRYLLSMGLICFIPLAVEIDIIATITESPDWMRHWFARIFSFQFTRIAIFHYLLTVDYISSRLQALGDELNSLRDYCLMNQLDVADSVLFNRLRFIKRSHLDLWLLCSHHSHRHSMFLLSLITSFFVCLTVDFYWIYANLYYGDNIFEIRKHCKDCYKINQLKKPVISRILSLCHSPHSNDPDDICPLRGHDPTGEQHWPPAARPKKKL